MQLLFWQSLAFRGRLAAAESALAQQLRFQKMNFCLNVRLPSREKLQRKRFVICPLPYISSRTPLTPHRE
jgi:hypothetical protein